MLRDPFDSISLFLRHKERRILFKAVLERECRISVRANGQPACCRQARSHRPISFFGLRHLHIFDLQDRLRPTRDPVIYQTNREESVMSSNYKLVFGVVLGAALGAAAVQGLHAQAKPKAYSVTETERHCPSGL